MRNIALPIFLFITQTVFSQSGQYVKDNKTGCQVWDEDYSSKDSISWNGPCKNGFATGTGVLHWYQDKKITASYTGQMKAGKFNGKGKYLIIDQARFEGFFINGNLEGKAAAYFKNGGKTIGNFVHGDFLNLGDKYLPKLKRVNLTIKDSTEIYGFDNGSDQLFYYALVPGKNIKAVLVLFPSTGESVENVISCNKELMQGCYDNQILSVVVSANFNRSLERDKPAMDFFEAVFEELVTKYKAPKDKFTLAGLSLGGNNALHYTEMSRNNRYHTYLKPLAVIAVDPPVDNAHLYYDAKREIALYEKEGAELTASKKAALHEDLFLIDYYQKLYGGSPAEVPELYREGAEFSRDQEDGGNAKYLIKVPVRSYCDPDIIWQLKNKSRDYYSMNAADLSAMTNYLIQHGNTRAEFITAVGKGFRVDGIRHPHSWSIVEPVNCVKWILDLAK